MLLKNTKSRKSSWTLKTNQHNIKKKINREVEDKVKKISQEKEQTQMKVVDQIQQPPKN